ncbi:MAG: glycoside hydrolase family 127 protein [Bacteroidales bacterium]|nr:glycoside hydrolase family 127 protein [Bacteroidales bacterium]
MPKTPNIKKYAAIFVLGLLCLACTPKPSDWTDASLADIRAEGWLKEKLITQREGLTGHPEALSYPYNTCLWAGEIPRMGTHGQDWWRYEQTAYYTDGLLRLGYLLDDRLTPEFLTAGSRYDMHGVTMSEMLKLPILLYAATRDPWYKELAVSSLDRLFEEDELPDGLFSSAEWLQGKGILHSHETCNAVDMTWTLGCFLEILKDPRYADRMEKIVLNAGAGSVTKDFKALQYYSSVNQFLATGTSNHNKDNYCSTWMAFRPTHQTECCAGNVHRLYPNYVARMWLRGDGEAVAALYGPSRFRFNEHLTFVEDTSYPYGETVRITAKTGKGRQRAKLTLRIPCWCHGASLTVNGAAAGGPLEPGRFVTLDRRWADGDVVLLSLPMEVLRQTAFGGGIWFERGPLVYSYAIPAHFRKDTVRYANMNGKYPADDEAFPCWDIRPAGPWNYAVDAGVNAAVVPGTDMAPRLRIPVHPIAWDFSKGPGGELLTPEFPDSLKVTGPVEELTLVPYGETTLRLTVFPVLP